MSAWLMEGSPGTFRAIVPGPNDGGTVAARSGVGKVLPPGDPPAVRRKGSRARPVHPARPRLAGRRDRRPVRGARLRRRGLLVVPGGPVPRPRGQRHRPRPSSSTPWSRWRTVVGLRPRDDRAGCWRLTFLRRAHEERRADPRHLLRRPGRSRRPWAAPVRAERSEIGWYSVDTDDADLVDAGPWFEWHHDRWVAPRARVLACTPAAEQAFAVGRTLAVQFHPEADAVDARRLAGQRRRQYIEARASTWRSSRADRARGACGRARPCLVDAFLARVATAPPPVGSARPAWDDEVPRPRAQL